VCFPPQEAAANITTENNTSEMVFIILMFCLGLNTIIRKNKKKIQKLKAPMLLKS
jgi:hypothetical protein